MTSALRVGALIVPVYQVGCRRRNDRRAIERIVRFGGATTAGLFVPWLGVLIAADQGSGTIAGMSSIRMAAP